AVKREWDTGALNQVWVGDITYLRTWEGCVYLATVIDAHSRRVIGWAIATHMRTDLIQDALMMAMTLRGERPGTSSSTAAAAPNMPRLRSPRSRSRMASLARWD
uniref:DDE-type integrase/transposase/recombinase n=1 Tax=Cryobacterium sp. Y57 TaxID=2048287 RepID=UPI001304B011